MRRKWPAVVLAGVLATAGCSSDLPTGGPGATTTSDQAAAKSEFFDQAQYERQLKFRSTTAEGPADKPWEQMLDPELVDTARFAKPGGDYHLCFSNASVDNPWRQVGF
ncbi:ABC transporter substrate-binding protein, partial [Actinosynnema sp. NPDC023926]